MRLGVVLDSGSGTVCVYSKISDYDLFNRSPSGSVQRASAGQQMFGPEYLKEKYHLTVVLYINETLCSKSS